MAELAYVPRAEIQRALDLPVDPAERTALFTTLCRINALYMIARAGAGHIGSSFSSLDIVSWLYIQVLRQPPAGDDVYFSSKGHDVPGLYAVLTALGVIPFSGIHHLRRLGGLPGHPDRTATPGMVTNTGSLGMGISKAKGLVLANRLLGRQGRVFVLSGDGELQEGQLWESLAGAAAQGLGEITLIVDHNKVQSDTWVERVSGLGDLESKFRAFGWAAARCDGHDPRALDGALSELAGAGSQPKAIIADTVKGRGVSFMAHTAMSPEERLYRYHSGAPTAEDYTRALGELVECANKALAAQGSEPLQLERERRPPSAAGAVRPQHLVAAYAEALVREAERDPHLVALDADLVRDCGLLPFEARFPERLFECGIAEQDMVSQAGAMALNGLRPVVHSFACFLSARPNEQIYNNATERTRIIYVGTLAGLLPAGPGHSHQAVRDIAALSGVPGLVMVQPCCEAEVPLALEYCLREAQQSSYLRLCSVPWQVPFQLAADYRLRPGQGITLREGADAVLFSYGPVMLSEAYEAAERLMAEYGIALAVVNLPWLNRVDPQWLRTVIGERHWVFTLDDHYVEGGQGERVATALAEVGFHGGRVCRLGVRSIPRCGENGEVLRAHGLDASGIASAVAAVLAEQPVTYADQDVGVEEPVRSDGAAIPAPLSATLNSCGRQRHELCGKL